MLGIGQIETRIAELIRGGRIPTKINQCVQAYQASVTSTTSTSMTDISGLTKNITPSSVYSQILIMVNVYVSNTSSNTWWTQLVRDSTTIGGDTNDYIDGGGANASAWNRNRVSVIYIDSPATTQETTYKVQWKCDGNTLYLNRTGSSDTRGGTSSITLMEVLV